MSVRTNDLSAMLHCHACLHTAPTNLSATCILHCNKLHHGSDIHQVMTMLTVRQGSPGMLPSIVKIVSKTIIRCKKAWGAYQEGLTPVVSVMHEELSAGVPHEGRHKGLGHRLQQPLHCAACQGHITCPADEGHLHILIPCLPSIHATDTNVTDTCVTHQSSAFPVFLSWHHCLITKSLL